METTKTDNNYKNYQNETRKGIDKLFDKIIENIHKISHDESRDESLKKQIKDNYKLISKCYTVVKDEFKNIERDDGERYFEHLREVTNIILDEMEDPSIRKVLIALLHDAIEDTEIDFHVIKVLFGADIAIGVKSISKEPIEKYMTTQERLGEKTEEIKARAKEKRNNEYFSHLYSFNNFKKHIKDIAISNGVVDLSEEDIENIAIDALNVKFADRIHNLRTQWDELNTDKVKRKLEETKIYFMDISREVNLPANGLILNEILNLEMKLENYNSRVDNIIDTKES